MRMGHVKHALRSAWFYRTIHISGFCLLADYFYNTADWRISISWGLAYFGIALVVSHLLARLGDSRRFQILNQYFTSSREKTDVSPRQSRDDWALLKSEYVKSFYNNAAIIVAPTEDALVCIPVLLAGISPLSAILGGVVFGAIHLGGYSYLECIAKGIYYTLIVLVVLPHGLLTVIFGHLITNAIGFVLLKIAARQLSAKRVGVNKK